MSDDQIDIQEIRKEFKQLGYLQELGGKSWSKTWNTKTFTRIFEIVWSPNKCWETLQSNGILKIHFLTFQKMIQVINGEQFKAYEIVIGPLCIMYGKV